MLNGTQNIFLNDFEKVWKIKRDKLKKKDKPYRELKGISTLE